MEPHLMPESQILPRNKEGLVELQVFVDPLFGSERYITFKPQWVESAEDKLLRLPFAPWRKFAVTMIKFRNGREYRVDGYWAEAILHAKAVSKPDDEVTNINL